MSSIPMAEHATAVSGGSATVAQEITIGSKGFAIDYADGKSKAMRVVAQTSSGCYLVTFFDGRCAQHTRRKDIRGITTKVGVPGEPKEVGSAVWSPFVVGEKVWARERGEWKRGRVIEIFGVHQTALVTFFHETGFPSQNTHFSEMSREQRKPG
jgi:hypothetical protein